MEMECLDEKYEGAYNSNTRDGLGRQQWPDGDTYEGEFCKDHLHGFGIYKWADGNYYQGTLYMDEREGVGKQYNKENDCLYQGLFRRNNFYGFGKVTYFSYDDNVSDINNEDNQSQIKNKLVESNINKNSSLTESTNCETNENYAEDIGLWVGKKLIKIFNKNENAFVFGDAVFNISKRTFKTESSNKNYFSQKLLNCFSENVSDVESKLFIDQLPQSSFSINNYLFLKSFANHTSIKNPFFGNTLNALWYKKGLMENLDVGTNDGSPNHLQNKNGNIIDASSTNTNYIHQNEMEEAGKIEKILTNDVKKTKSDDHNDETLGRTALKSDIWNTTPLLMRLQENTLKYSEELVDTCHTFKNFNLESGEFTGTIKKPGRLYMMSEALFESCIVGDEKKVKQLLDTKEIYTDVADHYGNTPLFYAAAAGQNNIVQILLDRGADIRRMNDVCMNVLYLTCAVQYRPDIAKLKRNDQNDSKTETYKKNFDNSYDDFSNVIKFLKIEKDGCENGLDRKMNGFDKENQNETNNNNSMIQHESNILQIKRRKTPLKFKLSLDGLYAFENNKKIENLQNRNSRETKQIHKENISKKNKKRSKKEKNVENEKDVKKDETNDVLDVALEDSGKVDKSKPSGTSKKDLTSTIKLLIRNGANVDPTNQKTIPSSISSHSSSPISPQPSQQPTSQPLSSSPLLPPFFPPSSPLLMAIEASDIHIVHSLLSYGADPNFCPFKPSGEQVSPIEVACSIEGPESIVMCQKLHDAGADVKGRSSKLVEMICMKNDKDNKISVKLLQLILNYINEPHVLDFTFSNHHSPLSYCINTKQLKLVDALLENQANINMSLNGGLTNALCVLIRNEHNNWSSEEQAIMLNKLTSNGANVTCAVEYEGKVGTIIDLINSLYKNSTSLRSRGNELKSIIMQAMTPKNPKTPDRNKKSIENLKKESVNNTSQEINIKELNSKESIPNAIIDQSQVANNKKSNEDLEVSNKHVLNMKGRNSLENNEKKLIGGRTKWDQNFQGKSVSRYCHNCGKSAGLKLFPCMKCRSVYYCGKLCMHISWNKEHQHNCAILLSAKKKRSAESKKLSAQKNNSNNENAKNTIKVDWTEEKKKKNFKNSTDIENLEIIDTDWQSFYETYYQTDSKGLSKLAKEWKKEKKNLLKKDFLANSVKEIDNKLTSLTIKKMDISKIKKEKDFQKSISVKSKNEVTKRFEVQVSKEWQGTSQQGLFVGNYSYI